MLNCDHILKPGHMKGRMWPLKMKHFKYPLLCLLAVLLIFAFAAVATAQEQSPAVVVEQLVAAMDSQQYDALVNLWVNQEQGSLRQFLGDPDAKAKALGLHSIKSAKLLGLKQLPLEAGARYGADTADFVSEYGNVSLFYVALDLRVRNESHWGFINGANYLLVVLVPEGDQWKIALMPQAPVAELNQDGYCFGNEAEKRP